MQDDSYSSILNTIQPIPTASSEPIQTKPEIQSIAINENEIISPKKENHIPPKKLFDINLFIEDVKTKTHEINKTQIENMISINSYSIAHECIREAFFKIMNYPVKDYSDNYLPIRLKSTLGNAVHDFIQTFSNTFTEIETSVKVPSIRMSCRMDALINNDVIVEIKSCTFKDFEFILRNQRPRDPDFLQVVLYKYLLENHLKECQEQTNIRTQPPKLDKYDINYFQFIYVANDVLASDANTVSEALKDVQNVKKILNSKYNQFYFINTITIDLSLFDITPHYNWIVNKINTLNNYLNNNRIPPKNDPFITQNCYFCIYKDICKKYA